MSVINSRKELHFFIEADRMMNKGCFKNSLLNGFKKVLLPDYIMIYLEALRKTSYYSNQKGLFNRLMANYWKLRHHRLGVKLGYDIGADALGYGVVIGHAGTIIVGSSNRIGNYAVLHTSTCISNNGKIIGDGLYLSAGVIITSPVTLGNFISIGANSLVNKDCLEDCVMLAGNPALIKKKAEPWYLTNGEKYKSRYEMVEQRRKELGL